MISFDATSVEAVQWICFSRWSIGKLM